MLRRGHERSAFLMLSLFWMTRVQGPRVCKSRRAPRQPDAWDGSNFKVWHLESPVLDSHMSYPLQRADVLTLPSSHVLRLLLDTYCYFP